MLGYCVVFRISDQELCGLYACFILVVQARCNISAEFRDAAADADGATAHSNLAGLHGFCRVSFGFLWFTAALSARRLRPVEPMPLSLNG